MSTAPTILNEIDQAVESYEERWQAFLSEHVVLAPLGLLPVTAVGWKVVDPAQYDRRLMELRGSCDRIIETWMNGRWVAKCLLREPLANGCRLVKLMQRRPGSKDAVGLDHLDFHCRDLAAVETALTAAGGGLDWRYETNDISPEWRWISLRFGDHEGKFKNYTVLDVDMAALESFARSSHRPPSRGN